MPSKLDEILAGGKEYIGFYGHPPSEILEDWQNKLGLELLDLDIDFGAAESGILPKNFCRIIANIINNGAALKPRLKAVIAATGMEKCDSGKYAAKILQEIGLQNVVYTTNETGYTGGEVILCEAKASLKKRVVRIMETVYRPLSAEEKAGYRAAIVKPSVGFWGTPPHPIKLLDLFPEDAHIFGWTRCVEAGRPADIDLECSVAENLPIIFFSQSFCNKAQLANYLAKKYGGMFVDCHDDIHKSLAARIEAFIRLNGV